MSRKLLVQRYMDILNGTGSRVLALGSWDVDYVVTVTSSKKFAIFQLL